MLRPKGQLTRCAIAAVLLLSTTARAEEEPAPAPRIGGVTTPSAAVIEAPVNLFLGGPGDLDSLLQKLEHPDFVLLKGEAFRKLLARAGEVPASAAKDAPAIVDSVVVKGAVHAERADLRVEYGITLRSDGPTWVPIRFDGQTVTGAREGERDLPLRGANGGWHVELRGAGVHRVQVDLKVLLRATVERRRIDVAIPEAASTRFAWDVDDRVADASTGGGELVEIGSTPGAPGSRLSAHLTPRSRLDVSWRAEAEPGALLPPLLTMQGEIAIDVDPGSFRTRSTWAVNGLRGSTRGLEFRLDPADEVLELELDGQAVPAGIERVDGATLLTIALGDPLHPGQSKSLVMTTRRPISTASSATIGFKGFMLTNAKEQSGAIGIVQGGNLWIGGTTGRGLREIDPRTELPPDLRARPATVRAYAFADQPFELVLRVEPSPPLVRTESRTTVMLDDGQARVETWLNYQTAHGRLFDLNIGLPDGLLLESVGPEEVVEASQGYSSAAAAAGARASNNTAAVAVAAAGARVVAVRLTPLAQEGDAFTIRLIGRQPIDPARSVDLALFQPLDATSGGGRIAVLTGRNVTLDLRDHRGGSGDGSGSGTGKRVDGVAGPFRDAPQEPPADWPWPADLPAGGSPPALWLRYDGSPPTLPLKVDVHPRALTHRTSLRVQVERRWLSIQQETECAVHFGTLDHVDVEAPPSLEGRWELEWGEVTGRTELGTTPRGDVLTRLALGKEVKDKARLRFRFRFPLSPRPEPERPTAIGVPWIRPVEGKAAPMQVRVASEPGIDLEPSGVGWTRVADEEAAAADSPGLPVRFVLERTATSAVPLSLMATAHALVEMPPLVASRLWLRTELGPEPALRSTAVYTVETHPGSLAVALPAGADWVRARVDGVPVGQVERLPKSAGYRLPLPNRGGNDRAIVELDYTIPATPTTGAWGAPQLLEGGLVQQTLWEVRVPWGVALVGVPPGWIDENRWAWDRYFFRRRPRQTAAVLAPLAVGSPTHATVADGFDDAPGDPPNYLFSRPGRPTVLRPRIISRGWLVGICSGSVLATGGILIAFRRPSVPLAWGVSLALLLACITLVQPSVTILAVQSAMLGLVLTLLTALMQGLVNRRRLAPAFGEPGGLATVVPTGSTLNRTIGVGSDDSTAIRVRPISTTVDHYVTGVPSNAERADASGRSPVAD